MNNSSSGFRLVVMVVAAVLIIGLVLRYGLSSDALLKDVNSIFGTLSLQGTTNYYGPTSPVAG